MNIYGIQKNSLIDPIYKAEIEILIQRTNVWLSGYQGEEGGGRNWEIGIDTYTLLILCIKYTTNGNLVAQETLLNAGGNLNGKEVQKGGDIFILMYSRN